MKIKITHCGMITILVLIVLGCYVGPALSADKELTDNLYITGILQSINPKTSTALVDVRSLNCLGLRTFATGNVGELDDFVGQKIEFQIDSSRCQKDTVYKMLTGVRVKK